MRSDMENWKEIRQQVLVHGLSHRAACEKYKLGWQTLKKILAHAEPPGYRKSQARPRPVLAPVLPIIHEILVADQKAPKKQRHTAKRHQVSVEKMSLFLTFLMTMLQLKNL